MSFILDALKKSENERQENAPAEFASVPSSPASARAPRWLWVLGGLLLINVAVLGITLASKTRQVPAEPQVASSPPLQANPTAAAPATFSERVQRARQQLPERPAAAAGADQRVEPVPAPATRIPERADTPEPRQESNFALLPSLDELRANGTLQVPDLHVDIHVFSDDPAERFVFINMNKYREKAQLTEGPLLREITPDGVVLDQDGTAFVLLRD